MSVAADAWEPTPVGASSPVPSPPAASPVSEIGPAVASVQRAFDAIAADGRPGIWIALTDQAVALARAAAIDDRVREGERLPLAGRTLAVKDNIDVAGLPTTAGCPSYAYRPSLDAPAVAALVAAGAIVIGKTNLDQFATGLVGTRSPYGPCPNARWDPLVSGGSSSGSAVAVAAGHVDLALGTDTAGSGRVPAAANGIVGVKPTIGRISTVGVVPACRSFDCVSVFATTVAEASRAASLAARGAPGSRRVAVHHRAPGPVRIGVPSGPSLHAAGMGELEQEAFAVARKLVRAALGVPKPFVVDLTPFAEAGALLYGGAFLAERFEAVGRFLASSPPDADPVVSRIILQGAEVTAVDLARDRSRLAVLRTEVAVLWDRIDALVLPTVPGLPTTDDVAADPVGVNAALGAFTTSTNLLDLAAVTIPVGPAPTIGTTSVGPPASVTFVGPAGSDRFLAELASTLA